MSLIANIHATLQHIRAKIDTLEQSPAILSAKKKILVAEESLGKLAAYVVHKLEEGNSTSVIDDGDAGCIHRELKGLYVKASVLAGNMEGDAEIMAGDAVRAIGHAVVEVSNHIEMYTEKAADALESSAEKVKGGEGKTEEEKKTDAGSAGGSTGSLQSKVEDPAPASDESVAEEVVEGRDQHELNCDAEYPEEGKEEAAIPPLRAEDEPLEKDETQI